MIKHINDKNEFTIKNEYDLHCKVVKFIRKKYPNLVLLVGLGELQDTASKRVASYKATEEDSLT